MRLGGRDDPPRGPLPFDAAALGTGSGGPVLFLAGLFGLSAVILGMLGFGSVEITEVALNYSLVTRKAEQRTYTSGRYWISPVNYFIKFPSTVTTIQFSDSKMQADLTNTERGEAELRSRTRDGLDVLIELSFQYQLRQDKVYELYTNLGGYPLYHNTFVRVAIDRLTEIATKYSATEFFNDRTLIGKKMEELLKADFKERLYSDIFSFQLRAVGLPADFEDAIQETEVKKQDLEVAEAQQNSTRVSLETELMQAKRRVKVVLNQAEAEAQMLLLNNDADITQYIASQQWGADSYADILKELGSNEAEMLAYMQARVLRDHPSAKTVVGLESRSAASAEAAPAA